MGKYMKTNKETLSGEDRVRYNGLVNGLREQLETDLNVNGELNKTFCSLVRSLPETTSWAEALKTIEEQLKAVTPKTFLDILDKARDLAKTIGDRIQKMRETAKKADPDFQNDKFVVLEALGNKEVNQKLGHGVTSEPAKPISEKFSEVYKLSADNVIDYREIAKRLLPLPDAVKEPLAKICGCTIGQVYIKKGIPFKERAVTCGYRKCGNKGRVVKPVWTKAYDANDDAFFYTNVQRWKESLKKDPEVFHEIDSATLELALKQANTDTTLLPDGWEETVVDGKPFYQYYV